MTTQNTTPDTRPRAFTDAFVRQIKADPQKRLEIRDTKTVGLLLRVTPKGVKSFALHTRAPNGKTLRLTLGRYPGITLSAARELTKRRLTEIANGADPRDQIREAKAQAASDAMTLRLLLDEAEAVFAQSRSVWRAGSRPDRKKAEARASIENVFGAILDDPLADLTVHDFSRAVQNYTPKRPLRGKATATGAASRALNYLRTVVNWASWRSPFNGLGKGRSPQLSIPDLSVIVDPSVTDESITHRRDRVLMEAELAALVPLLTYPAPEALRERLPADADFAPIALKFLLLTMSRLDEVCSATWGDVDLAAATWRKKVKGRCKPGSMSEFKRREIVVPLSTAAIRLLRSLPKAGPDKLIFPSRNGNRLRNPARVTTALQTASRTSDWHRHDLRRTGSTILYQLGVSPTVIDGLLGHKNPLESANISKAAPSYLIKTTVLQNRPDMDREALEQLAEVIEGFSGATEGPVPVTPAIPAQPSIPVPSASGAAPRKSPWAV